MIKGLAVNVNSYIQINQKEKFKIGILGFGNEEFDGTDMKF